MHLSVTKKEVRQYFVLSGIAVALGIIAGFVAILFRYLIFGLQHGFYLGGNPVDNDLYIFILFIPAIGGLLTGLITYFFASEAKGHGIPEVGSGLLALLAPASSFASGRPRNRG